MLGNRQVGQPKGNLGPNEMRSNGGAMFTLCLIQPDGNTAFLSSYSCFFVQCAFGLYFWWIDEVVFHPPD